MTEFSDVVSALLDDYFALQPVNATDVGLHEHDGRWPDMTEPGLTARLAFYDRAVQALRAHPDEELDHDERLDRDLLLGEFTTAAFSEGELREDRWDALAWVYLLGNGLFPLLSRDFAPVHLRLASIASRLEGLPAVVEAAVEQLVGLPGRPISRLHAETTIDQLAGIADLVDEATALAAAHPDDDAVLAVAPRLEAAAEATMTALERLERHLRTVVLPTSSGEGRLGAELYERKLGHVLRDPTLTPGRLLERAEREYEAVRAEMIRLARELWPRWHPDLPVPDAESHGSQAVADQQTVRGVLDAIAFQHQAPAGLLDYCREELVRIEAFCRDRDVVGLPEEPLEIRWTPTFLRAFGGAMLIPPGPLDRGQKSFFAITPIPDDWSPERAESWLREDNDRMLRILTIHEAVPGHYLQLACSNRHRSLARAAFYDGTFAEGWAVYVTQVMMDLGYGAEDPALMLVHWKYYLRAIINTIIDIRIHSHGMGEDEAVALMIEGGFQEEAEAHNKYKRVRLSSTQLVTYFVGSFLLWELEAERRRRLAEASGDRRGAASVVIRDLPGGLGESPGFRYREHLETVLAHGTPPIPILRQAVLGD